MIFISVLLQANRLRNSYWLVCYNNKITTHATGRGLVLKLACCIIFQMQFFQAEPSSLYGSWLHLDSSVSLWRYLGTHRAGVMALDLIICCRVWCSHSDTPWLKSPQINWDHFMGLWEHRMPDLHFQVAGEDFSSSPCHTGHIAHPSLTTLRPNPQVAARAGLYIAG